MQSIYLVLDILLRFPTKSSTYGLQLERRIFENLLLRW